MYYSALLVIYNEKLMTYIRLRISYSELLRTESEAFGLYIRPGKVLLDPHLFNLIQQMQAGHVFLIKKPSDKIGELNVNPFGRSTGVIIKSPAG